MIQIIAIGKIKEKAMHQLIEEFEKRMTKIHKMEILELSKSKHKDTEVEKILLDEEGKILSKIKDDDYVILLDLDGKQVDSIKLAKLIDKEVSLNKRLVFIIGGSHGVSQEIKRRANYKWQLSFLTFPHQLVRLMLVEQIYRSFMIIKQHPYHK